MNDPVAEFEHRFSKLLGSEYAIAVNSGTSALHAALEAIDVRGKEVIMPALCPAMDAFAIIHAGGTPVFADVDPQTQLVTDETIAHVFSPRTKAVIAVALHGLPADIDKIIGLCRPHGVLVVEDCAQSLLSRYKDAYAGVKADMGCFSFERKKHMTTGSEGGMILTNNPDLATRARKFSGLGYKHMTADAGRTSLNAADFQHPSYQRFDTIGLNYRMSWVQAEAGLKALTHVQDDVWRRQEIGYLWQHALGCQLQPHDYDAENTFYSAAFVPQWHPEADIDAWRHFYRRFCESGGDGFYAMARLPYEEPALAIYGTANPFWGERHPIAAHLQSRLMLFKTHYKTLQEARHQTEILQDMLAKVS